ncbi:MAG: hypothetical protein J6S60_07340 [Oscillospiraceae bacterium]|nr:hypothetical protein [Oscillospiraceae bacterium]
MAWNPMFPVGYQPAQMPGWNNQMFQPTQQNQQSKLVEAIPVDTIDEAKNCPMAAGTTAFFFARDDSFNAVKSVALNGEVTFREYHYRPPAAPAPAPEYMTRADVEAMISAALPKRSVKKEAAEE